MNMIYCSLARQIRHRFKWRKVGEWVIAFSPPQWGKCRQHSHDHAFTSQLKQLVLSTWCPMALPSFCPSPTLSFASAPHPQYGKALSVTPIKAPKFPKKLPERHNYPAAISITVFPRLQDLPVHGVIHRISHTGREHLELFGHVFFWIFLLLLLPCLHPCTKHSILKRS